MKVKIGPYLTYWGPYQVADLVFWNPPKTWITEDELTWRHRWSERLGDWLAKTWVNQLCEWIYSKRERQIYVRVDRYDTWNMDETLKHIIHPLLVQLRSTKHGSGNVDDEDVPQHLQSTSAPPTEEAWDLDDNFHLRYEWLLDELIWVFGTDHEANRSQFFNHGDIDTALPIMEQIKTTKLDREGLQAYDARVQNAYRLFGKYYQTFWD